MRIVSFDFEEIRLKEEITKRAPKTVLLQLPEGLKPEGPRLAAIVEDAGALPIISSDPCYGACDLAVSEAKLLGADLIIHYGHTPLAVDSDVPTVYFETRAKIGIKEAITNALPYLESWTKIGLVTTVQHVHQINEAKKLLEEMGMECFLKAIKVGKFSYLRDGEGQLHNTRFKGYIESIEVEKPKEDKQNYGYSMEIELWANQAQDLVEIGKRKTEITKLLGLEKNNQQIDPVQIFIYKWVKSKAETA